MPTGHEESLVFGSSIPTERPILAKSRDPFWVRSVYVLWSRGGADCGMSADVIGGNITKWVRNRRITWLPMVLVLAVAVACGSEAGSGGTDRV